MISTCKELIAECARPQGMESPALNTALRSRTYSALMRVLERTAPSCDEAALCERFLTSAINHWSDLNYRVSPGLGALDDRPGEESLLALLTWLTGLGVAGEWELELGTERIAFIGGVELPLKGRVKCVSTGQRCRVTSCAGVAELSRDRTSSAWKSELNKDLSNLAGCSGDYILYHQDHPLVSRNFLEGLPLAHRADAAQAIARALTLIDETSPSLACWTRRVIAGITLVDRPDGMTRSGSSALWPGLLFVSAPIHLEHLAVLLVHEASHQYFHLLSYHVDLVLPYSTEKFFSPFKGTERPISRILLALHACANIVRYTSGRLEHGGRDPVLLREHTSTVSAIGSMASSLSNATSLTDSGRYFLQLMQ